MLIFALIIVIVAALLVYAVDFLPLGRLAGIAKALILVIAAVLILSRIGGV